MAQVPRHFLSEWQTVSEDQIYMVASGTPVEIDSYNVLRISGSGLNSQDKRHINGVLETATKVYGPSRGAIMFGGLGGDRVLPQPRIPKY